MYISKIQNYSMNFKKIHIEPNDRNIVNDADYGELYRNLYSSDSITLFRKLETEADIDVNILPITIDKKPLVRIEMKNKDGRNYSPSYKDFEPKNCSAPILIEVCLLAMKNIEKKTAKLNQISAKANEIQEILASPESF